MPAYRLYCLDGAGGFLRARWIAADDDEQAVIYVRARECDDHHCELWERDRLVASIARRDAACNQCRLGRSNSTFE